MACPICGHPYDGVCGHVRRPDPLTEESAFLRRLADPDADDDAPHVPDVAVIDSASQPPLVVPPVGPVVMCRAPVDVDDVRMIAGEPTAVRVVAECTLPPGHAGAHAVRPSA